MTSGKSRKHGKSSVLSTGDLALWREVTRDIEPLHRDSFHELKKAIDQAQRAEVSLKPGRKQDRPLPPESASRPLRQLPAAIEPKLKRKLRRGRQDIEARLDLHGMTQEAAHRALREFIFTCHARRQSLVLVITGKGSGYKYEPRDGVSSVGVLKRMVPYWLAGADMAGMVIGFEEASARHGGSGALYVRLRRRNVDGAMPDRDSTGDG